MGAFNRVGGGGGGRGRRGDRLASGYTRIGNIIITGVVHLISSCMWVQYLYSIDSTVDTSSM